jgi:hypothetical protein
MVVSVLMVLVSLLCGNHFANGAEEPGVKSSAGRVGGVRCREVPGYYQLESEEFSVRVNKSTGLLQSVQYRPSSITLIPDTPQGMTIYLWNKTTDKYTLLNVLKEAPGVVDRPRTLRQTDAPTEKCMTLRYVVGPADLALKDLADAEITYTLYETRFDIKVTLRYLTTDPSVFELGVSHPLIPENWMKQLYCGHGDLVDLPPDKKVTAYYGFSYQDVTSGDNDNGKTGGLDRLPDGQGPYLHYPFGILENKDIYFLWGYRDIGSYTMIGTNYPTPQSKGGVPGFFVRPKGINRGESYSFDYSLKVFPKAENNLTDILRWYLSNIYSTNPLTKDIIFKPHVPSTLPEGNVCIAYDSFHLPVYQPDLVAAQDNAALNLAFNNHACYWGWYKWDETAPTSGEWKAVWNDPKIMLTADKVKQEIRRMQSLGLRPYLYFREMYHPEKRWDEPPYSNWMRMDKHGKPMIGWNYVIGDFDNEYFRTWFINQVKNAVDFYDPDGISWDIGWHYGVVWGYNHGILRMQHDIYKWMKEKHPEKRIIQNEAIYSPSLLFADAAMYEGGKAGKDDGRIVDLGKAFNTVLVNLTYVDFFKNIWHTTDEEHIQSVMRGLGYGATWGGSLVEYFEHPEHANRRGLYLNALATLAEFSAKANNIPMVSNSHVLKVIPGNPKVKGSVWADFIRLQVAVFNDDSQSVDFVVKLDKEILAKYGWSGESRFLVTILGPDGQPRSKNEEISGRDRKGYIEIKCSLKSKEALLLVGR